MKNDIWVSQLGGLDELGAPAEPRSPLLDATVMMVDDEPLMTELVHAYLEDEGYENFVATNDPHAAMAMLKQHEPGVLLLDLMMPGLSGFELLELIRRERAYRYIPVIVLTAATGSDTKLRALQLGATDFLSKPVDPSELVLRVRNALAFRQYHQRMVNFDIASGLPNQRLFERSITQAIDDAALLQGHVALLNVSVPECRQVRETFGQSAGDGLARALGERLSRLSSQLAARHGHTADGGATVARLSADEFGLMLCGLPNVQAIEAAVQLVQRELGAAVAVGSHEIVPNASVGVAVSPGDAQHTDSLVKAAELARSQAQQRGGGHQFFSAEISARSYERLALGSQLRYAVARNELRLHYQPKVDLRTGRIIGAEALMRWQHPEQGLIAPFRFIPLAEELGLIGAMGNWVIEQACSDAARWRRDGLGDIKVAVNVAQPQFEGGALCGVLRDALAASGLPARLLVAELTESMLIRDADMALATMHQIKALGVSLSIDDFGTGYSSLSYLKRLPIDELKIDRSFVNDLPGGERDIAIVRTIIALGHNLGMTVVAEGVEIEAQLHALQNMGCDTYQGFWFSKPLPEAQFDAFVRARLTEFPVEASLAA